MGSRTRSARHAALLAAMLLATTVYLPGCAVFGKGQPVKVTATLQRVQDDYTQAELQTEATEDALDELSISPDVDLKQAYDSFSKSAYSVQETGNRLVTHADEMHFRGAAYFVESAKSPTACVFPPLPKPGNQRTEEIGTYFDEISGDAWEVKRVLRAFQFDLSQIQNSLYNNLTPKSIDTIRPMIEKAKVDADSLKYSLEQALSAVERAKTAKAQKAEKGG